MSWVLMPWWYNFGAGYQQLGHRLSRIAIIMTKIIWIIKYFHGGCLGCWCSGNAILEPGHQQLGYQPRGTAIIGMALSLLGTIKPLPELEYLQTSRQERVYDAIKSFAIGFHLRLGPRCTICRSDWPLRLKPADSYNFWTIKLAI